MAHPPGYTYDESLDASPVSSEELDLLLATVLWTDDDGVALRRAGELLTPRIDDILDLWYGFVGSHPHLVTYFDGPGGEPSPEYLAAVRLRFGRWISDLTTRDWDREWLNYQYEIARRHTDLMGRTDSIATAHGHIALRYLIAFVVPITATIRGFLAEGAGPDDDVDAMHQAWFKAVTLTVTLWAQPYAPGRW